MRLRRIQRTKAVAPAPSPQAKAWFCLLGGKALTRSCGSPRLLLEMAGGSAHRQLVSEGTEAGDHAHRDVGEIGMPPEGLACVRVRKVHFKEGQLARRTRIP